VAILVVDVEAMDLAEKDDCEYKMRELVREHHQPMHILPHPRNEKDKEKGNKAQGQITVELKPFPWKVHLEGLDQNAEGEHDEKGQQYAVQYQGESL
jgi:hypothetical protein